MIQRMSGRNFHYTNAQEAFIALYDLVNDGGELLENGTKALFNVGFYLLDPLENQIDLSWRRWNHIYAEREWAWYISGDRSVEEIKKYAPIWDTMHSGDNRVNSNYGWQWQREHQLDRCIDQLKNDAS